MREGGKEGERESRRNKRGRRADKYEDVDTYKSNCLLHYATV